MPKLIKEQFLLTIERPNHLSATNLRLNIKDALHDHQNNAMGGEKLFGGKFSLRQLPKKQKLYIVEIGIRYEGSDQLGIYPSLKKADKAIEEWQKTGSADYVNIDVWELEGKFIECLPRLRRSGNGYEKADQE